MAGKKIELGPTGRTVAENIATLRTRQNLTWTDVSRRLQERGREIPPVGIKRIEAMERRIDVDDLVAIATALNVAPAALLMPRTTHPSDEVTATGMGTTTARELWRWIVADAAGRPDAPRIHPGYPSIDLDSFLLSRPEWLNSEEFPSDEELASDPAAKRRAMRMMRDLIDEALEDRPHGDD
ncbi:helix-turn-helix domain-containing protein [Rhodococcus gordoniae]|uniref:helix-turn-helix domain-containing protein n=1 Tax=Rhodococcus gordoniae TaxID=223392 RepID=UPI0020CF895D|nr:helix-turn-helix transcriptional regulator [Rhodococcus gordoniae]UTT48855.1 helix-turn-helix domain-containing protein [Rhodococcus gordoniae]